MTAQPDRWESAGIEDTVQLCSDCGRPVEAGAEKSFRVCRACYDAYVDNAGR